MLLQQALHGAPLVLGLQHVVLLQRVSEASGAAGTCHSARHFRPEEDAFGPRPLQVLSANQDDLVAVEGDVDGRLSLTTDDEFREDREHLAGGASENERSSTATSSL